MPSTLTVPAIPWFEVLWYQDHDGIIQDVFTEDFTNKDDAMAFYEQHKHDAGKYGWKVTKRTYEFKILETYVDDFSEVAQ